MLNTLPKSIRHGVFAFGISALIFRYHSYVGTVVYCEGVSMEPTVKDGDYLIVERLSVVSGRIKKGDIVIAGQPRLSYNFSYVLKRIKGLEEDQVTFTDVSHLNTVIKKVPRNHVWLEGDNTQNSLDSRTYGPVPISQLEYKVLFRIWPLKNFGRL